MRRLHLWIISLFLLLFVICPLCVYGSPDVSLAIERAARIFFLSAGCFLGWKIVTKFPPRGLSALLAVLACWSTRAAEPATHQVELTRQAAAYQVGDFVDVLDADGRTFTVQIEKITGKDVHVLTAADEKVTLPVERIVKKVGSIARAWAWLTDTTAGNWTLAGGGGLLALGGGKLVSDAQVSSDKDTDQTTTAAAAASAQLAAEGALRNGTVDGTKYFISGTFIGPQAFTANGAWIPALTLSTNPDGFGGSVLRATIQNKPDGSEQVIEGKGTWAVLRQGVIIIRGVDETYNGDAALSGVSPYGPTAFSGASLRLANGATLTGGTAQSGNPPEVNP